MSLVLVGEANPYGGDRRDALYHLPREASGNRLREHLGLRDSTYAAIAKVNLCGVVWSLREARARAIEVFADHEVIVCLGVKVRRAVCSRLGWEEPEFFSCVGASGQRGSRFDLTVVALPHPSGMCRVWNDESARGRARALLRSVASEIPWGEID